MHSVCGQVFRNDVGTTPRRLRERKQKKLPVAVLFRIRRASQSSGSLLNMLKRMSRSHVLHGSTWIYMGSMKEYKFQGNDVKKMPCDISK